MSNAKLRKINEEYIKYILYGACDDFFNITTTPKDCKLTFKVQKIDGDKVYVKFTWVTDLENYDKECNTWEEVNDSYYGVYIFTADIDSILDEIVSDLEERVQVKY